MTNPLLSIVIANYNYGRFLEEAINSVLSQNEDKMAELIICDAKSNDNSVEVIRKYACGLPPNTHRSEWPDNSKFSDSNSQLISWWCSEKDGGQSAAFNKGFVHARGAWLSWLNADDLMLPGTLDAFRRLVAKKDTAQWISGNMLSFDNDTKRIVQVNWGPHSHPPILKKRHSFNAVFGPTTFFKKELYLKAGSIDESLHYAMDTEYWARLTMLGVRQVRLNHLCWAFRIHNESKTEGCQTQKLTEKRNQETEYWRKKTGYDFGVSLLNPSYLYWLFWRLIDGSWVVRMAKKIKLEGKTVGSLL